MALTADESHLVYEILGIPNSTSVLYLDSAFGTGRTQLSPAILQSKALIDAALGNLQIGVEDRLHVLLAQWLKVATDGVKLKAVGQNYGVDRNPARERRLIRNAVRKCIPVFIEGIDNPGGQGVALG